VPTQVVSSTKQKQLLTKMFTASVNPKEFTINPCRVIHLNPFDQESEEKFVDMHNPVCAHCIRLYMACATFLQTFPHWDPVFVNDQIDLFSTNPLLAQMPSTVLLYIIYCYFTYLLTILDTYIILYACLVFWVHFVLAQAICVSCRLYILHSW